MPHDRSLTPTDTPRRWHVLALLALTQLVVVLDGTIVSIALPAAQASLGLTDTQRQWVVTAYALAFGALLLLGGRIADFWGRKRSFLLGLGGFGVASAVGGFATGGAELILARGLQGVFAALMAPAALALLTVTFPGGRERTTAFAVFGTVGGAGAAVGLVLGGALTQWADWRWCLWVNVPVVLVVLAGGGVLLRESRAEGDTRYDGWGALTVAAGLGSLVYGLTLAEGGWTELAPYPFVGLGVVLLAVFVVLQRRSSHPLLPLRVVTDRTRAGAFLLQAVAGAIMIGATLYLTLHLQVALGFSPLASGLASLPFAGTIMVVAGVATRLLPVVGPRRLMIAGPLVGAVGLLWLSRISADGSYVTQVLPPMVVLGAGMALLFVPMQNLALAGISPHDAGVASATANAAMQVGGSVGLSLFTTAYVARLGDGPVTPDALVRGYSAVFLCAAATLLVGAVLAAVLVRGRTEDLLPDGVRTDLVHVG